MKFLRRSKGDKKSLLKPKRFFGKKADRSDSVDDRSKFSKGKEEAPKFENLPEIALEAPINSNLDVTILTQESTPPVTPSKYGEEGSISDTISDLSASMAPCLPATRKPPSPAEKMMITSIGGASNQHGSAQGGSGTFHTHRGASQKTAETGQSDASSFSIMEMMDKACVMPWSSSPTDDVMTMEKDSSLNTWGIAPSADDDEQGGPLLETSANDKAPNESAGEPLPSDGAGDTRSSVVVGDTLPSVAEENTTTDAYDDDENDYGNYDEDEKSEEQEGYELVLDPTTGEDNETKKSMAGAVWKRMKITKSRAVTPPVKEEELKEKFQAAFGEDPDRSLNKRSNSFFSRLNNRSKTPEPKLMDDVRATETTEEDDDDAQKPQMINLAEEGLYPEDLLDHEGEREEHEDNQTRENDAVESKPEASEEQPKKDTILRSRSWNIASALKRSLSTDKSKRPTSEPGDGSREDTAAASLGLLSLLSASPKKAEKPKLEEPRPPKPVWKAAVDPNTGTTYYYHRLTRQTTWTKPPDFDKQHLPKEVGGGMSAEQQKKVEDGVEVTGTLGNVSSILRNGSDDGSQRPYTKKQEHIKELLLDMSPPDPASVDKIIDEYRGREDELIDQLNEIVESQPFDEPINKGHGSDRYREPGAAEEAKKSSSFRLPLSTKGRSLKNRVMTASTNHTGRSNLTGLSNFSGNSRQTLKTGNTTTAARNSAKFRPVVSDLSRSSIDHTPYRSGSFQGRPPLPGKKQEDAKDLSPVKEVKAPSPHEPQMAKPRRTVQEAEASSPVKVVKAPRNRELLVEEYSSSSRYGLRAEKYSGKALHGGRRRPFREPKAPQQLQPEKEMSDEADSFATDSVSGLSASDAGFNTRKDEFDAAARSALDDAIRNRDWELAATVTDEMRGQNYHAAVGNDDATPEDWTQSSLDKFISDNDWDAVAKYIASMRDRNAQANPEDAHPPSNYKGGPARKRFGARSQLQHDLEHNGLDQSSSWDSGTSFGSEFYSTDSNDSPLNSPQRVPSDSRKNFAC